MDINTVATIVATWLADLDSNTVGTWVVAAATTVSAYIGLRAWRQQQADRQPVVELRHRWDSDGSLSLWVTIRNRLGESMVVEEARVLRLRGALLTQDMIRSAYGDEVGFEPAKEAMIRLDRNVAPVGTPDPRMLGAQMRFGGTTPNETIRMNVQFPRGWRGGLLKIALRIVSVSLDEKQRRVTIKRRIPAPP